MNDERASGGWLPGSTAPSKVGVYERCSAMGIALDAWDGKAWRRYSVSPPLRHRVFSAGEDVDYAGVICANQDLPWRSPA